MCEVRRLFSGEVLDGWLSNELQLAAECPDEFRNPGNKWHCYARTIVYNGLDQTGWKWLGDEKLVAGWTRELNFRKYLDAPHSRIYIQDKIAILAWMLTFIIKEPPHEVRNSSNGTVWNF